MKNKIFLVLILSSLFFLNCNSENQSDSGSKKTSGGAVIHLSEADFKKLVFNYEVNSEWKYEGNKPAIIDFYADWCAPCRQLSPKIDEIAKKYKGKINVYKVDTDKENNLAVRLGITGLPTLLFIPANGKPSMTMGLLSDEDLAKALKDVLLIN